MAKLSDLPLDPDPTPDQQHDDLRRRDNFVTQCDFLLDGEKWRFAWDTVSSMRDRVQAGSQPTERMWQALKNIEEGGRRGSGEGQRWGRRYEGHRHG